ncbi:MAG TPA: 5'-nucleotidase C-terminal domain-containing protein, partial [Acidimicrobiales bacterium]
NHETGQPLFAPFTVRHLGDVDVAFIGMTLQDTPTIVDSAGIRGWDFLDEAETANALVPVLKGMGVETIVVLLHEGGFPTGGYNSCPGISGPIVDIVNHFDDEIDAVISGHTHTAYNCVIDGRPVTSAASFGRIITDLDLTIDNATNEVVSVSAVNRIVTRDVRPSTAVVKLVDRYRAIAAPLANRPIGSITANITRAQNAAGESALGDVIADAQLASTDGADEGGAIAAFMNPGGIRADLTYASSPAGEGDGVVTYGEAFTVQPFGNTLTTLTLTGSQIDTMLEQQWCGQVSPRILQVSNGFTYSWSASAPACNRVDASTIAVNGVAIDPSASYRVTVNSFLAGGGDGFTVLNQGTNRLGGLVDVDSFEDHLVANSPVAPGPQNRITLVP